MSNNKKNLQGKKLLVLRAREGSSLLSQRLIDLGAEITEAPKIHSIRFVGSDKAIRDIFIKLDENSKDTIIVLTDTFILQWLLESHLKKMQQFKNSFLLIGEKLVKYSNEKNISDIPFILGMCKEDLLAHKKTLSQKKSYILLNCKDHLAGLIGYFKEIGTHLEVVSLWQREITWPNINKKFDGVISASSSGVRLLNISPNSPIIDLLFSIGPKTTLEGKKFGFNKVVEAKKDSINSMVDMISEYFLSNKKV